MGAFHSVYGLLISSNIAVPGLPTLSALDSKADIQIWLKDDGFPVPYNGSLSENYYESRVKDQSGSPVLQAAESIDGNYIALQYSDGTHFVLQRDGSQVIVDWPDSLTLEDSVPYLVGPVLGVVLRLRGIFPLHASAVAIDGRAIALMGSAGAGKSTTAGAFARCGYRVISDDVVALKQDGSSFVVPPGYPRVNLWTESVHALFGDDAALPLICPSWDKQYMPLNKESEFETRSLPLGVIYVLQERQPGLAAPIVENISGSEAFLAMLGNTYMNHLPDTDLRSRELEVLGRVLAQVPVRRIQAPADRSKLFELCATIAADARALFLGPAI